MWEKVRLGDVCEIFGGSTPSTKESDFWNGDILWLSPSDLPEVGEISIVSNTERKITNTAIAKTKLKVLPKGSVVFSSRASIGKIGITANVLTTNQGFVNFVCGERVLNRYLAYCLKSSIPAIKKLGNSTTFLEVSRNSIRDFKIPLPPLPVQQRIADMLDKADALRRKDQELLKKYDELAQAIFIEMFSDPVKNEKGWEVKSLGELCTKIGSGATPRGGKEAYKDEGISLIRSLNIHNNEFKMKDLAFIDDNQARQLRNVIVQEDDVLFNITGASVCRASIVPKRVLPARVNQHVAILRSNPQVLNPVYLVRLLTHRTFNAYLYNMAMQGGATREAITKDQLETLPIPLPPVPLQNQFREKIKIVNAVKIKSDTDKSEELFQSLLQRAFKSALVK